MDVRPLIDGDRHQAFSLLCEVWVADSVLHRSLGIGPDQYREHLRPSFEPMMAEGLSLVAVDDSDAVVGCLVATDFAGVARSSTPGDPEQAPIEALLSPLEASYRRERSPAPGNVLLVDMAAVALASRGRGIYRSLREEVHRAGADAGFTHVVGELSSTATQHLCVGRFGHRVVAEIDYATFEFDGARPFAAIMDPRSIQLVEGSLL